MTAEDEVAFDPSSLLAGVSSFLLGALPSLEEPAEGLHPLCLRLAAPDSSV